MNKIFDVTADKMKETMSTFTLSEIYQQPATWKKTCAQIKAHKDELKQFIDQVITCEDFDVILTAEAKGIPLAYEMSRQSGKQWIPARKGVKGYMADPVIVEDQSITTAGKQTLVIDKKDLDYMNGKRILVVDDVISTGGSLHALDALAARSSGTIVAQAAVLAEGDAAERKDIIFLEPLPLFAH